MLYGFRPVLVLALSGLTLALGRATEGQKNIAIIGAGAAGSSTAYHLSKFAEEGGLAVNITIFEKTDRVGGRTLTVNVYDNDSFPVELGASIFVEVNSILYNAVKRYGLSLKDPGFEGSGSLAVWDGESFRYTQNDSSSWWWNLTKLFWKYGWAPYRTQNLVKGAIGTFLKLYRPPYFPFRSLTQRAFELELSKLTGMTGEQYLAQNKINNAFSQDIIQASTRVNYATNLAHIHGLETMVALAPEGAVQVVGGNWRIFASMVKNSSSTLYKQTAVTSISLDSEESRHPKFLISTKSFAGDEKAMSGTYPTVFDTVVIASPWQYSDIQAGKGLIEHSIDEIPYVKLHVTLFTSPFRLSPKFFNLDPGAQSPTTILTTLSPQDEPKPGAEAAGKPGFFSISTQRTVMNPKTSKQEYVYKVFSPQPLTRDFLSSLLGVEVPESLTGLPKGRAMEPISWYYPHVFHSYPIEFPRVTFQDPILREGLYYTSGIESFISCMETSALMGMNVARLIADDILGVAKEARTGSKGENQGESIPRGRLGDGEL